nr:glycoside hydrolase domain-containing protein [Prevotella sp. 10(H)]
MRNSLAWNEVLGRIMVQGDDDTEKSVFYTSLYRCFESSV